MPAIRGAQFVALVALLMSLGALSTNAMLPALPTIGRDLGTPRPNDVQFVVTSVFLGLGIGQMLFGPLSDRIGRKAAIHAALALFMAGCVVSVFASTFHAMIAGRVLQGIGVAGPRVVTMALVRDQYEGARMARLMSMALALSILVPTVAPALGQVIVWLSRWRAIFTTFFSRRLRRNCVGRARSRACLTAPRLRNCSHGAEGSSTGPAYGEQSGVRAAAVPEGGDCIEVG